MPRLNATSSVQNAVRFYTDPDGQFLHGTSGSRSVPELLEALEQPAKASH